MWNLPFQIVSFFFKNRKYSYQQEVGNDVIFLEVLKSNFKID